MTDWTADALMLFIAALLVFANGFFVAAEFALVKVRPSRLDELVKTQRPFAVAARWLFERMDASLSACQLGITIASLGLGWIGEPAFAHLLRPLLLALGISSEVVIHTTAFVIAFGIITAIHLVLGEQAPKIASIRNPETVLLLCAAPLKLFYFLSYPFLIALSSTTSLLLRVTGIQGSSEHEIPHSEKELRALIRESHIHGQLSRSEHRLLSAVFDFDELISRRVMVPRADVVTVEAGSSLAQVLDLAVGTRHSRYPVCEGSLDKVLGVMHVRDLIGKENEAGFDWKTVMRAPQFVPENLPVRRLLRQFQESRQHMAFLVDEYGTVTGMVTLENILESIVGSLEDEFDLETPDIVSEGPQQFVVSGTIPLEIVNRQLDLKLEGEAVETLSGLLMSKTDRLPAEGDRIELTGAEAEVLEVKDRRAVKIRLMLAQPPPK